MKKSNILTTYTVYNFIFLSKFLHEVTKITFLHIMNQRLYNRISCQCIITKNSMEKSHV